MNILSHLTQFASSTQLSASEGAAAAVFFATFLFFMIAVTVASYVLWAWLLGRVFHKAGVEKWIAWVPFYNTWKLLEMGGQKGFWAVLSIIPIVNYVAVVFLYIAMYHVGLKFGKEGWWVVLAIFIPIVWIAILAFDDSKWHGSPVQSA